MPVEDEDGQPGEHERTKDRNENRTGPRSPLAQTSLVAPLCVYACSRSICTEGHRPLSACLPRGLSSSRVPPYKSLPRGRATCFATRRPFRAREEVPTYSEYCVVTDQLWERFGLKEQGKQALLELLAESCSISESRAVLGLAGHFVELLAERRVV